MEEKDVKKLFEETEDTFIDTGVEGLDSALDDIAVEVKNAVEEAKVQIEESFNEMMKKINEIDLSKEKIDETIAQWKDGFQKTMDETETKVKAFCDEQKNADYWTKAKEVYNEVSNAVITSVTDAYNKAMENDGVKKTVNSIKVTAKNAYDYLSDKYQQFIHDEDVKRTVVGCADFVKNLYKDTYDIFFHDETIEETNDEKEE